MAARPSSATVADGSITNAKVASGAAIAESKLSLASDAAAGTASRRTLGTGAQQAAAGNHTHDDRYYTEAETAALVAAAAPWNAWMHGQGRPATNTGFTTLGTSGQRTSAAQNDEIGWDVYLAAGTWEFWLLHITNNNRGIYTVTLDGASVGTIDGYSAGSVSYVESPIAGHVVATAGLKRLLLKMSTKNASSSGYVGSIQLVGMRRTA